MANYLINYTVVAGPVPHGAASTSVSANDVVSAMIAFSAFLKTQSHVESDVKDVTMTQQ